MVNRKSKLSDDPLWYKDAVIYELHVKTFCDSNGDGMGDFKGLISKLDYLENLGITAIWLLPFYPSPLRDDGYDIADYYNVHQNYGTLQHFKEFLDKAHDRGIRVITELVINHTSDQHKWFEKSRTAKKKSPWRDYYIWSDSPDKYSDARIIFTDFENSNWTWDPVAKAYYWHRFYSHQPDLNFENPRVQKAILKVVDFWFDMGVDGLRLDAVPYLYEEEGTNCENLPQTHDFLRKIRAHVDRKYKNRMLLAEANQWPEDSVEYFGKGDECHMAFHFPIMPRMFMAVQMEDNFPITDILDPPLDIPEDCQWAVFLRNHDELTLEMVTDEERDYMYRSYASDPRAKINLGIRRRLAPLLGNSRRRIELMNILLLSMPGTPVLYYGDEIGMGDNYYLGDRDGVRTPMQWSSDRNAGFSRANPHSLYLPVIIDPQYHYEAVNAEVQEHNVSSLLWWMRRVIAMRKKHKALSRGGINFLTSENRRVLAFLREFDGETILVIANLSRFSQVVELELNEMEGRIPREMFSQNEFPQITDKPYTLTLTPHGHFWLRLDRSEDIEEKRPEHTVYKIALDEGEELSEPIVLAQLERGALRKYFQNARWFAGKGRSVMNLEIRDQIRLRGTEITTLILIVEVSYKEEDPEIYMMPVVIAGKENMNNILEECPQAVVAEVENGHQDFFVYDASFESGFRDALLDMIRKRRILKGGEGTLTPRRGRAFKQLNDILEEKEYTSRLLGVEQSNTSFTFDEAFVMKLYRKLESGENPDTEVVRMLTEKARFDHVPAFAGSLEYRKSARDSVSIGILQQYVPNQGDGWSFALGQAGQYFERILTDQPERPEIEETENVDILPSYRYDGRFVDRAGPFFSEIIGLLGRRTGELHEALASARTEKEFAPERFSTLYQRSVYQSIRSQIRLSLELLGKRQRKLASEAKNLASEVLDSRSQLYKLASRITDRKIDARKIRIHGDYHLGQVLFTGKDLAIIDFEGEPAHTISERRIKRSPLRDVAGMVRSFHYVAHSGMRQNPSIRQEDYSALDPWAELWSNYVSGIYLDSYRDTVGKADFIPKNNIDFINLFQAFLLEKAAYEIGYELNNRPDWVIIPLKGILQILNLSRAKTKGSDTK